MQVSECDVFDEARNVNIDPDLIDGDSMFNGGMRGKSEYRRAVSIDAIFGRHGTTTYFRGSCWDCGSTFVGVRLEKRKKLLKCPDCGETSFIYKGFFNDFDRYPLGEYEIPNSDERSEPAFIVLTQYASLDPVLNIWTEETYNEKQNGDFYDSVELTRVIE